MTKPDCHLSSVHRSISFSHHEFMQAKLEKCSGLYESYFNPFSAPDSVFRCTCHWIFKSLGWIPQPEFQKILFPETGVNTLIFQKSANNQNLQKLYCWCHQVSQFFFQSSTITNIENLNTGILSVLTEVSAVFYWLSSSNFSVLHTVKYVLYVHILFTHVSIEVI